MARQGSDFVGHFGGGRARHRGFVNPRMGKRVKASALVIEFPKRRPIKNEGMPLAIVPAHGVCLQDSNTPRERPNNVPEKTRI